MLPWAKEFNMYPCPFHKKPPPIHQDGTNTLQLFTEECWNHRESSSNYTKNCTNTDIHQYHGDTRSFCKVFHVFFHVFLHHLPSIAKSHHGLSPGIVKKQNLVSMQKKLAPQSHVHLSPSITSDFDVLCLSEQKRSQHCGNSTENHGSFSAVLNMDLFEGRKEWHVGVGPTPSWDAAFVILSITGFVALLMCFFWLNWSRCDLFLLWGEEGRKDHKAKLHSESSDFLPSFYFQNSLLLLVSPLLLLLLLLVSELPLLGLLWLLLLAATIIISCQWRPERNPSKSGSQLFGIYGGVIGYKRFDFLVDHSYLIHPSDRDAGHLVRYLSIYSLHDALQLCSRTQLIEPRSGWRLTHMISSFGHGNI